MPLLPVYVHRVIRGIVLAAGTIASAIGIWEAPGFLYEKFSLLYSWGGETPIRIIVTILGILLIVVAAAGPTRLREWMGYVTGSSRGLTDEELKQRLRELSVRIYELHGDYQQEQSRIVYEHHHEMGQAGTEEERQRLHNREVTELSRNSDRTMVKYSRNYETQALSLFDDAIERGLHNNTEDRRWLENPTNPLGVRQVAQILGTIGNKS